MWESYRDTLGFYREKSLKDTLNSREGSKRAVEFLWATKRLDQYKSISMDYLQETIGKKKKTKKKKKKKKKAKP